MRKRTVGLAVALAVLLVGVAGVAYASIPGGDGVIHGCYKTSNPAQGSVIIIDSAASCPSGFTALNWSQTGPQGPSGLTGYEVAHNSASYSLGSATFSLSTGCPTGKVALGGGGSVDSQTSFVRGSFPSSFNGSGHPTGWRVEWNETGYPAFTSVNVDVWAICALPPS